MERPRYRFNFENGEFLIIIANLLASEKRHIYRRISRKAIARRSGIHSPHHTISFLALVYGGTANFITLENSGSIAN